MPRVLEPIANAEERVASENEALKRLFEDARSDFERSVLSKRAVFERYLETRVNWLRMQLMREAEATDSLDLNHLDFLRAFKPDSVPEEYQLSESDRGSERLRKPTPLPPASALRVIKTVRRVAARSRINQTASPVDQPMEIDLVSSTPCIAPTKAAGASMRSNLALNLSKAARVERDGGPATTRRNPPRRAAAIANLQFSSTLLHQSPILQKLPTVSVFDRDSILFTSSGSPVANPFAHLSEEVVVEIKRILNAKRV